MNKKRLIAIFIVLGLCLLLSVSFLAKKKLNSLQGIIGNFDLQDSDLLIFNDTEVVQTIYSFDDNLGKISVLFDPRGDYYGNSLIDLLYTNLDIELTDSNGNTIEQYTIDHVFFDKNSDFGITIEFPTIKDSKNKVYYLHMKSIRNEGFALAIAKSMNCSDKLLINGAESDYSLIYSVKYIDETVPSYVYIVSITLFIILLISLIVFLYNKTPIHTYFLLAVSLLCLINIIIVPIYGDKDEYQHFIRVYDLSKGNIIETSENNWPEAKVPQSIGANDFKFYSELNDSINSYKEKDGTLVVDMEYSSVYSPLTFFPQLIGITVAKVVTNNDFFWPYIVRLFQAVFCIACLYYAVKIIPFGKKTLSLICLLPTSIDAITLVSPDTVLFASFTVFISKILQLSYTDCKITKKDYIILGISTVLVAVSKLVYFPLTLLLLLVYLNRKKEKNIKMNLIIILIISLLVTFLWNIVALSLLKNGQGVNVNYYINHYINNPLEFIAITVHTLFYSIGNFISDLFGGRNLWFGTVIDDASIVPSLFLVLYIIFIFKDENRLNKRDKKIIGIILAITYLLISTSLLFSCTPVNSREIMGIQGRYFLPFLLCIFLMCCNNKKENIKMDITNFVIIGAYLYYFLAVFVSHV